MTYLEWNYRIVFKDGSYGIHEVYYDNEDGDGQPVAWSEDPVGIYGDTFDELVEDVSRYRRAFAKPVLVEVVEDGKEKLVEYHEGPEQPTEMAGE